MAFLLRASVYLLVCVPLCARADVFELKSGGEVVGKLVDRGSSGEYVVKSEEGAVVTLGRLQVDRVVAQDKQDLEYAELVRKLPDNLETHRRLAEWCKSHGMNRELEYHRERILEFDPNDEDARSSLGYQKHQGRWMTRDEIMAERGLTLFQGDYRTQQDIALRQHEKAHVESEAEWFRQIRIWRGWLDDRRAAEAHNSITSITDPDAAPALIRLLDKENNQEVRDLYLGTLAELHHPGVPRTLVAFSLDDPLEYVRMRAIDYLLRYHRPVSITPYVKTLGSKDNEMVNRAAQALQELGNPEAISPLIDALVTRHRFKNLDAPPGDMNVGMSTAPGGGGGGLSMGGGPKVINKDLPNVSVRLALNELSGGQDFGFDELVWLRWYVTEQSREFVDTRRDN